MVFAAIAFAILRGQGDPTSALPINEVPARILPGTAPGWKVVTAGAHRIDSLTGAALTTVEFGLTSMSTARIQATVSFLPAHVEPGAFLLDSTRSQSPPLWGKIGSGSVGRLSVERRYAKIGGSPAGVAVWHGPVLVQVYLRGTQSVKPEYRAANLDELANLLLARSIRVRNLRQEDVHSAPYRLLSSHIAGPGGTFKLVSASAGPARIAESPMTAKRNPMVDSEVLHLRWVSSQGGGLSLRATFCPSAQAAERVERLMIHPGTKLQVKRPHVKLPSNLPATVNGKPVRWTMPPDRPEPKPDRRGVVTVSSRPQYQLAIARRGVLVVSVEITGLRGGALNACQVAAGALESLSVQTRN